MTREELIAKCYFHVGAAAGAQELNHHEDYAKHMSTLLDLLIEELIGPVPGPSADPSKPFNPERVLAEIALAIKYRTISHTHRWKIIFYHERITCVPAYADVPSQIVLHEFTERMTHRGFTTIYWNQLKTNVIKLYKELES